MSLLFKCYAECRYAEWHYAGCRYAGCRYAECHYAECRCAIEEAVSIKNVALETI